MPARESRYEGVAPFREPAGGRPAFAGLRPRPIETPRAVLEHRVQDGDRLDLLAHHYYNDSRLWWWIADANPEAVDGGELLAEAGQVLLIPGARR